MVDDKFIDPFIEDMIELDFLNDNRFFIRGDIKNRKYVFSEHAVWLSHEGIVGLLKNIRETDKVYIHWYDFYMGDLCLKFLNPKVELSTILWGGEFFQEPEWYHLFRILENKTLWKIIKLNCVSSGSKGIINFFKNFFNFLRIIKRDFKIYKKKKLHVARVDNILVHKYDLPDVELVEKIYKNKFKKHVPFFYRFNFDHAAGIESNNNTSSILKILVGNSFNHSNNHFDAFDNLKKLLKEPYQIHCPLSYGNSEVVRDLIIDYGKYLFGHSFHPIVKFMNIKMYSEYLNKMDAAYFNHIRSQAAGNIITMLSMEKPVFMNKKNTLYLMLVNLGISGVYSTGEFRNFIENREQFKIDRHKNSILLEKYFSRTTRLNYLKEAFLDTNNYSLEN